MGGVCTECPAGYWDCGPGQLCQGGGGLEEDKVHTLVVLGRKTKRGCLQARLWVQGVAFPAGWKRWGKVGSEVKIRVSTKWGTDTAGNASPQVRVYVTPIPAGFKDQECPRDWVRGPDLLLSPMKARAKAKTKAANKKTRRKVKKK